MTTHAKRGHRFGLQALISGLGISTLADGLLLVVLPVWVYQFTGSALQSSLMFAVQVAPKFLFVTVAGFMVDRLEKKPLLIVSYVVRAALVTILFFNFSSESLWLVYVILGLDATVTTFAQPASNALVPHLVTPERLPSANGALSTTYSAAQLSSPVLGSFILSTLDVSYAIGTAVILYALALSCLLLLPSFRTTVEAPKGFLQSSIRGFAYIASHRSLLTLHVSLILAWFTQGLLLATAIPWLDSLPGVNTNAFGMVVAAMGLGMVVGGLIASFGIKWSIFNMFAYGLLGTATGLAAVSFLDNLWLILIGFAFSGVFFVLASVASPTIIQSLTETSYLGRVFSIQGAIIEGGRLMGLLATPLLLLVVPASITVLIGATASAIAAGIFLLFALPKQSPLVDSVPEG